MTAAAAHIRDLHRDFFASDLVRQAVAIRHAARELIVSCDGDDRDIVHRALDAFGMAHRASAVAYDDVHAAADYVGEAAADLWRARETLQRRDEVRAAWRLIGMAVVA